MSDLSMFSLEGKVMIVTGAGRGIGKAIAIEAARAGADLVIGSRTMTELEAVAETVRGFGQRCEFLTVDVVNVDVVNGCGE